MRQRWIPAVLVAAAAAYACRESPGAPTAPVVSHDVAATVIFASISKQISASWFHGCALDSLQKAWCWGNGWQGELGNYVGTDTNLPVPVTGGRAYTAISSGFHHSCAITPASQLYCWGGNGDSHTVLGGGTTANYTATPTLVTGGHFYSQVSAGTLYTCAVSLASALYCWGENAWGALGDGTKGPSASVERIGSARSWLMVSTGSYHTCGITTDSAAYCWGLNSYGMLGTGDTATRLRPALVKGGHHFARIAVHYYNSCGIDGAGTAWCWGENNYAQLGINRSAPDWALVPKKVVGTLKWTDIQPDAASVCGLAASGSIYCWGQGNYYTGYLDDRDSVPRKLRTSQHFVALGTGTTLSCAHGDDRRFYCWGLGANGMLGNGSDNATLTPVRVKSLFSIY